MRFGIVAACLALVFAVGAPSLAAAQQAESVLHHVAEVHVKPGLAAQFEAAHLARNERLRTAGVSFATNASVSESLVYRFFTPVGDYAGLGRRASEMAGLAPAGPGGPSASEAIDHVETYLRWIEPDLGYLPASPRIEDGGWGVVQRVRLYVQQGMMGGVADALRELAALYQANGSAERRIVTRRALGSDSPVMEVFLFGTDLADLYTHSAQTEAQLGDALQEIRTRIGSMCRRIEIENFTVRPDLNYQPPS
jgi:hypothetical protein